MGIFKRIKRWLAGEHECMFEQNDVIAHAAHSILKIGKNVPTPKCVKCGSPLPLEKTT